jgi:hypothetical protein
MKEINLGGKLLNLKVIGVDEALEKINLLNEKLKEANQLINEIASFKIKINFENYSENDL